MYLVRIFDKFGDIASEQVISTRAKAHRFARSWLGMLGHDSGYANIAKSYL